MCKTGEQTLYDSLPDFLLIGFHFEIEQNIHKGILTETMRYELNLIKDEAKRRGLSLTNVVLPDYESWISSKGSADFM